MVTEAHETDQKSDCQQSEDSDRQFPEHKGSALIAKSGRHLFREVS